MAARSQSRRRSPGGSPCNAPRAVATNDRALALYRAEGFRTVVAWPQWSLDAQDPGRAADAVVVFGGADPGQELPSCRPADPRAGGAGPT